MLVRRCPAAALSLILLMAACGTEAPLPRVLVGTWALDPASLPSPANLEPKLAEGMKEGSEGAQALLKSLQAMMSGMASLMKALEFEFRADGTFEVGSRMGGKLVAARTGRWTLAGEEVLLTHAPAPEGVGSPGAEPPKALRWRGDALEMPGKSAGTPPALLRRKP